MSSERCGVASCEEVRFMHACALQVRLWSLRNCVTGLTQRGCLSLPTISHRQCRAWQTEEAGSGWATSSPQLKGGFYGVWQPLQIGHRQAAPFASIQLPPPSLLVAARRGTKTRVMGFKWFWWWWWGWGRCFAVKGVSNDTSDAEGAEGLQEVTGRRGNAPRWHKVPLGEGGRAASSTLCLSEMVVFDNTVRAQLTGRRHNGTKSCASQAETRRNFKWQQRSTEPIWECHRLADAPCH